MKYLFILTTLFILVVNSFAQKSDVVSIQKKDLAFKYLQTGNSTYVVYFKKTEDGPAEKITLIKINVAPTNLNGKKAYAITQQWDSGDAVTHTAYTVHDAEDFSTLRHDIWWKSRNFTAKFDFSTKQVSLEGAAVDESAKSKISQDFKRSFASYNLCWHSDLTIFPLFPYKAGRVFKVNFYDPGAGESKIAEYTVTGSEFLTGSGGERIDSWIMERKSEIPSGGTYVQRFWISKKTQEVLKEEDKYPGGLRFKMKVGISGEK